MKTKRILVLLFLGLFVAAGAFADEVADILSLHSQALDMIWLVLAAALVFFMQAGFAMVETGLTRAKNASNILMKNLMDFSLGSLIFWAFGFALMFGPTLGGWIGTGGFFLSGYTDKSWTYVFLIFQTVFAATAATIVSGAMAERTKFIGYLCYTVVITGLIYPVFGSWAWGSLFAGQGWLEDLGFIDFAGSTVVHSVGGWAGLAGAIVLGPRIGKYDSEGRPRPILGHNLPLGALGVFILWFGWFGFNPGSSTAGTDYSIASIAVNTNLAAAAGAIGAMIVAWFKFKKPDVSMSLNGALAGLVAITAGCANVSPVSSVIIGLAAGMIVVFSVLSLEKWGLDDPVGAVSVHGVCGAWGTLAAGMFNSGGFSLAIVEVQLIGIGAAFVWTFGTAFIAFKIIDAVVGLRVSPEEESAGLDYTEHGGEAYPDFQLTNVH